MKTVTLNKQRLEDLAKGLDVITTKSKKKGEYLIYDPPQEIFDEHGKTICEIGEVRQAVNEKGDKQWYCRACKILIPQFKTKLELMQNPLQYHLFHMLKGKKKPCPTPIISIGESCPKWRADIKNSKLVPLLVRLTKIEEETYDKTEEFWFKTWRQKK